MPGTCEAVRVDKSAKCGVVVSGLQIVEARLRVVVVTAVAERIQIADLSGKAGGGIIGRGQQIAVGVVAVLGHQLAVCVQQTDHVALEVRENVEARAGAALLIESIRGRFSD